MGAEESGEQEEHPALVAQKDEYETGEELYYDMYDADKAKKSKKPDAYKKVDKINDSIFVVSARGDETLFVLKQKTLLDASEKNKEKIKFAFRAIQMLSHPFIVQGKKVFTAKKSDLITILEYCACKDLRTVIKEEHLPPLAEPNNPPKYMDPDTILSYVTQLALALEQTHTNKMNHRNFSSEHIFIKPLVLNDPDGPRCAMLGNFGNAIMQRDNAATKSTITFNDPYYMSPENVPLYRTDTSAIVPGKKSDIFALGILMLEMCNLERMGENNTEGVPLWEQNGKNLPLTAYHDMINQAKANYPQLAHIMDALLTEDKFQRPLASQVLQLHLVKEKAQEIIKSTLFKQEMFERLKNKLTLGWAGKDDIERYQALWTQSMGNTPMSTNPNEVKEMIDQWAKQYYDRIFAGQSRDNQDYDHVYGVVPPEDEDEEML